jgi:hypothetical protein
VFAFGAITTITLRSWIYATLLCLVLISPLIFILALGVPIFFQDEWGLVAFLEKVWHGQSTFRDYWTAFDEHRIFLPRLIFASIYRPDSVDPRHVMVLSWFIMSVIYVLAICCFFLKRPGMTGSSKFLYAFCFLSLGLSLVQYENWLWALQLDFFLTQAFVILATIFIGLDALGIGTRSLLVALCALGASLSSGQGMLLWLSNALCVLIIARTWVSRGLLAFGFICGMMFFVWLYHADGSGQLSQSSRLFWIFHNPLESVRTYLALIGNPLSYCFGFSRLKQAPVVGLALVILFTCQISVVFKRKLFRHSIPFILLASFGFFYCGLVTLGRGENGINEFFLTSRYATGSLSIPLALVGLSFTIAIYSKRQDRCIEIDFPSLYFPLLFALVLSLCSELQAVDWASKDSSARRLAAGLLPFATLFDGVTDGVPTGPFYSLCPVGKAAIIGKDILPAMKVDFIPGLRDLKVTPLAGIGVQLKTDAKCKHVLYLNSHIDPRVLEGRVWIPERITPQAILLRKPGEAKYLAAAMLVKEEQSAKGFFVYRWMFLILPELDPDPRAGFEAAVLDEKGATLYPLETAFGTRLY